MYNELEMPPYVVNSARVDLLSAIPLLCQYCQSFSSDQYTVYAPEWYLETNALNRVRVVILMPLPCPIKEPVQVGCLQTQALLVSTENYIVIGVRKIVIFEVQAIRD